MMYELTELNLVKPAIEIGNKYKFGEKLYHVRGFIDDMVIFRWWNKYRQRWIYEAESRNIFMYGIERQYYIKK